MENKKISYILPSNLQVIDNELKNNNLPSIIDFYTPQELDKFKTADANEPLVVQDIIGYDVNTLSYLNTLDFEKTKNMLHKDVGGKLTLPLLVKHCDISLKTSISTTENEKYGWYVADINDTPEQIFPYHEDVQMTIIPDSNIPNNNKFQLHSEGSEKFLFGFQWYSKLPNEQETQFSGVSKENVLQILQEYDKSQYVSGVLRTVDITPNTIERKGMSK